MDNMPIIRLELDTIKETINYAFAARSENFNAMVADALDKALSVDTLRGRIEQEVQKAVDGAIKGLCENHTIRSIVIDFVSAALAAQTEKIHNQTLEGEDTSQSEQ